MNFKDFKKEKIVTKNSKNYGTLKELDKVKKSILENEHKDLSEDFDLDIEDNSEEVDQKIEQLFDGYLGEKNFDPNPLEYGPNATYRKNGTVYKKSIDNLWETYLQDGKQGPKGSAGGSGTGVQEVQKISTEISTTLISSASNEITNQLVLTVTSAISSIPKDSNFVREIDFSPLKISGVESTSSTIISPRSLTSIQMPNCSVIKFTYQGYGNFFIRQGTSTTSATILDYVDYGGYDNFIGVQTFYLDRIPGTTHLSILGDGFGTLSIQYGMNKSQYIETQTSSSDQIYVNNGIGISGSGTISSPYTLSAAKNYIRTLTSGTYDKDLYVNLIGGEYEISSTINFNSDDCFKYNNKIIFRPYNNQTVNIIGGKNLSFNQFSKITSSDSNYSKINSSIVSGVYVLDVNSLFGLTSASSQALKNQYYGVIRERGFGKELASYIELTIDDKTLELARYPNRTDNIPNQSTSGDQFIIYGSASPNVSGVYNKVGTKDGASVFARSGLVNGVQYYLSRTVWSDVANGHDIGYIWFISTISGSNPTSAQWSSTGRPDPDIFYPSSNESSAALGWLFPRNPHDSKYGYVRTEVSPINNSFYFTDNRISAWSSATNPWIDIWVAEWDNKNYKISAVNNSTKLITLSGATLNTQFNPGLFFSVYNILEELENTNEMYLDTSSGKMYLYPENLTSASNIKLSINENDIFKFLSSRNIEFHNINFDNSRKNQVYLSGCQNIKFIRNNFKNSGGSCLEIYYSSNIDISGCVLSGCGHSAVIIKDCGDRKNLIKSNINIKNCKFNNYGRFQRSGIMGIYMGGCGINVENNLFEDAPDRAINYAGNECNIIKNEFSNLCKYSADAGVIYTGGWASRGNIIKNNFFHDIQSYLYEYNTHGIYCDDGGQGVYSEGNIFYNIKGSTHKFSNRDCIIINNIVTNCDYMFYVYDTKSSQNETYLDNIKQYDYQNYPWSVKYPSCSAIPNSWAILSASPGLWQEPSNCIASRNLNYNHTFGWIYSLNIASSRFINGTTLSADNIKNQDPLFVDVDNLNMNLLPNSPAFNMPGFKAIPFDEIGLID